MQFSLLQDTLDKTPKDVLELPNATKIVRLNEMLNYHQQSGTLASFVENLGTIVLSSIQIPRNPKAGLAFDQLQPMTTFILSVLVGSKSWTDLFSHFLSQLVTKSCSLETTWQIVQIASVLLQSQKLPKRKCDLSSLQNCLIGIVSKITETTSTEHQSLNYSDIKQTANSLLKESFLQ